MAPPLLANLPEIKYHCNGCKAEASSYIQAAKHADHSGGISALTKKGPVGVKCEHCGSTACLKGVKRGELEFHVYCQACIMIGGSFLRGLPMTLRKNPVNFGLIEVCVQLNNLCCSKCESAKHLNLCADGNIRCEECLMEDPILRTMQLYRAVSSQFIKAVESAVMESADPEDDDDPERTALLGRIRNLMFKTTSRQTKMHYSYKNEYMQSLTYNVFLEEAVDGAWLSGISTKLEHNMMLHFAIDQAMDLLPRFSKRVKSTPFAENQCLFLMEAKSAELESAEKPQIWCYRVVNAHRGSGSITVNVELYPWSATNFPAGVKTVSILACGFVSSQALYAADTMADSWFNDLILGGREVSAPASPHIEAVTATVGEDRPDSPRSEEFSDYLDAVESTSSSEFSLSRQSSLIPTPSTLSAITSNASSTPWSSLAPTPSTSSAATPSTPSMSEAASPPLSPSAGPLVLTRTNSLDSISSTETFTFTFKTELNNSQKQAVSSALTERVTCVRGPPGSGKTQTIKEIVLQLLEQDLHGPIVVCAASNLAVDNITSMLAEDYADSIIRVVSFSREDEYTEKHPFAHVCLHQRMRNALPPELKTQYIRMKKQNAMTPYEYQQTISGINVYGMKILRRAKVILCTSVGLASFYVRKLKSIPAIIMDEATQTSEPNVLIPLAARGLQKVVFVGDDAQLSCFTRVRSLETSFFERALKNETFDRPIMLSTQYRMHPEISEFPRNEFYDGLLLDGVTAEERTHPRAKYPLFFLDHSGDKSATETVEEDALYPSIYNSYEVVTVLAMVEMLLRRGVDPTDIGIMTGYSAQRKRIAEALEGSTILSQKAPKRVDRSEDIGDYVKTSTVRIVSGIIVATMQSFQGREKDFIIMSCVRSNEDGTIGYLTDRRRMNVALTRAKCSLLFTGDTSCLTKHSKLWERYVDYLKQKGRIFTKLTDY